MQKRAKERCQELREDWMLRLSGWKANQLLFIDESAANERSKDRKYGWAPIGVTPHEYIPLKRSVRWSILPVYSIDGYLAWDVRHGSYDSTAFNEFIANYVLPQCNPFPASRSVLVMDNAPIHRSVVKYPSALEKKPLIMI